MVDSVSRRSINVAVVAVFSRQGCCEDDDLPAESVLERGGGGDTDAVSAPDGELSSTESREYDGRPCPYELLLVTRCSVG